MNRKNLLYVVITCLIFANIFIYSNIITDKIPESNYSDTSFENGTSDNSTALNDLSELSPDSKHIYANVADTKSGSLILVNKDHAFTFDNNSTLVQKAQNESVYSAKTENYFVKDINVSLDTEAISAFNMMMDDFYVHNNKKKTIIVTQGYRTFEQQKEMLDLKIAQYGENQTIAQTPGFSEHHTGYALDISTYINKIMGTFTGENEYKWIFENAHKYGFVLRYPAGKESITGISYESWHFRYVGSPHAQYMYQNNLTLEEYIPLLSTYNYGTSHLEITDEVTGALYEIYTIPVAADNTKIPVPASITGTSYKVSGDNCGNIVVTIKKETM